MQAATFGLALVASQAVGETAYFSDAKFVLDEMSKAKAAIDIAAWHAVDVSSATSAIVLAAQHHLDEKTIPCTEWPTPSEVAGVALEAARHRVVPASPVPLPDENLRLSLLRKKVATNDVLDLTVENLGSQKYRAVVNRVLSNRFCALPPSVRTLEFVGTPGNWGNPTLQDGQRALVFIRPINGRYYEDCWYSHLSLEVVDGRLLAIAAWHLNKSGFSFGPKYLRESVVTPDPAKPWRTGFPLELIERHIHEEIALHSAL